MDKRHADLDQPLVLVVDDDESVQSSIKNLLESVGLESAGFGTVQQLLDSELYERPGCMVLDVRLPGLSGLDFQRNLNSGAKKKPIIFLTGHADISMTVQAMKAGAIDFLTKPFREQNLLDAVKIAFEQDVAQRAAAAIVGREISLFEALTSRERQVLREIANGRLNKQIAFDLGISQVTVKLHRGNIMRKMQAASVGALIRSWEILPTKIRERLSIVA
ncbi:MAG TPA: response regulator transcription factor [Xanthobacteraceae bacterium]|jgi:FixJ family two-component response regulator|nr:response regulator transcription factor [Xanthobacteraceae bacterium]